VAPWPVEQWIPGQRNRGSCADDAAAETPGKVGFAPSVSNPGLRALAGPHGDGSSVATVALWWARMSAITVSVVRSR
jgi:hypothetical protein